MTAVTNLIAIQPYSWSPTNATLTRAQTPLTDITPGSGSQGAAKLVASASGAMQIGLTVSGLTVGQNYVFSFYAKVSSSVADFSVVPQVSNGATVIVKGTQPAQRSGSDYRRRYIGFKATATSLGFFITTGGSVSANDTMWIDRVMLTAGSTVYPYFNGAYPFSSWSGTAYASTSTNTAFDSQYAITTDEVVVVGSGGLPLNTEAWNITSKTGRNTVSGSRGDDITVPGVSGKTFVPNKPIDSGLYTLTMWIAGIHPDGTIPVAPAQRKVFQENYEAILRACYNNAVTVKLYSWQPDGTVRTTDATLIGNSPDPTLNVAGRRAEVSIVFDILSGMWKDAVSTTVNGTPSASWSNQTLACPGLANGTAPIEDSVITVTGPITNPTVSNPATNTSVTYTGTVPAGQTWVIDSGQWTSQVNGASVLSSTTHTGHARFIVLDPGATGVGPTIKLTGSGTTSATNLSVTAYRKHLVGS